MHYDDFIQRISTIAWFSRVGQYSSEVHVGIPNLKAWDHEDFPEHLDPYLAHIAATMDWLPSTIYDQDTIGAEVLNQPLPNDVQHKVNKAYRLAYQSLRGFDQSKFRSGPHSYAQVAKGGAIYCVRKTAAEIVLSKPGMWLKIFHIFSLGFWPCGVLEDKKTLIVY